MEDPFENQHLNTQVQAAFLLLPSVLWQGNTVSYLSVR